MKSENFEELLKARFGECIAVMNCTYETAEMIKYMSNCFFATKVSFMNEMYQIAEKIKCQLATGNRWSCSRW